MSLSIICQWSHNDGRSIEERIQHAAAVFSAPDVQSLVGQQWFRGGKSKRDALSKPVPMSAFGEIKTWDRSLLTPEIYMYGLSLWNGRDYPESFSLSVTLQAPPERTSPHFSPNQFLLSGFEINQLQARNIAWTSILAVAQFMAEEFKGRSMIRSDELYKIGEQNCGIEEPDIPAYAAFWGGCGSERHPTSMIVCKSWDEARSPDCARLRELAALLKQS